MTYEIYNMPEFYKIITRSALSGWNLVNTDCWAGTSAIQVCAAPQYPDMLVDRCHSAVITITAEGLQILPSNTIFYIIFSIFYDYRLYKATNLITIRRSFCFLPAYIFLLTTFFICVLLSFQSCVIVMIICSVILDKKV